MKHASNKSICGNIGLHVLRAMAAAALLVAGVNQAHAHATAIGYTPGVNPGEVNLWLGSYHQNGIGDGNDLEGSAELTGVTPLVYDTINPFTYSTPYSATPFVPAGLVSGVNLIFAAGYGTSSMYSWEAVTISGLSAGDYVFTYVPQANPTLHWFPNSSLNGITLTLTAGDVGGGGSNVPDGGSTALLMGLGLLGLGSTRRMWAPMLCA